MFITDNGVMRDSIYIAEPRLFKGDSVMSSAPARESFTRNFSDSCGNIIACYVCRSTYTKRGQIVNDYSVEPIGEKRIFNIKNPVNLNDAVMEAL